jgi:hypothetical protein
MTEGDDSTGSIGGLPLRVPNIFRYLEAFIQTDCNRRSENTPGGKRSGSVSV